MLGPTQSSDGVPGRLGRRPQGRRPEGRRPRGGRIGGYVIQGELARGGMGVVYRALHPRLGRLVALKVLLAGEAASAKQKERFRLEAEAAARLRHPGIVAIHDVGQDGEVPYLVMDLIEGESLAARLDRQGPLDAREAAALVADVAEALACAHDRLVLHRDIKPANVLLDRDGRPRLTDFGLAKTLDAEGPQGPTITGQVLGTPVYMSPEQAAGLPLDVRADVYSLGATLYELLTGGPPFESDAALVLLARIAREEAVPPSRRRPAELAGVDRDLDTIVLACLEKEPERRYASARALAADLRRYLAHEPIAARRAGAVERLRKWARRNPALARVAAGSLATVAALAAGAIVWVDAARRGARGELAAAARGETLAALSVLETPAASPDERTAAALDALEAAQGWHALAAHDPAAASAHYEAALALGEVALASEQWALATQAFVEAEVSGVDPAAAQARREEVARARTAEAERREAEVRGLLVRAARGELGRQREGVLEAAFRVVRHADPRTAAILCEALETATSALRSGRRLSRGEEDLARLTCEALGRIGLREAAVPALVAYLEAEEDPLRAVPAGQALARLGGREALAVVHEARRRFGIDSPFSGGVAGALAAAGVAVEPGGGARPARGSRGFDDLLREADELRAQGQLREAEALYTRAIELAPAHAASWSHRGHVRQKLGELHKAHADLTRALELAPRDLASWNNRGSVRRELGDLEGALADYSRAIELEPRFAAAWSNRSGVRKALGDLEGAIVDCSKAVELDHHEAAIWGMLAGLLYDGGRIQRAREAADKAIALEPDLPLGYYHRALARRAGGDPQGALADLNRVLELDPQDPRAYVTRGLVREALGDLQGALADHSRAIELDPAMSAAWSDRGVVREALGDYDAAVADYERARELDPKAPGNWVNLGSVRHKQGELEEAVRCYTRAIDMSPDLGVAYAGRGFALTDLEREAEAIADLERFLELAPEHPAAAQAREVLAELRGATE